MTIAFFSDSYTPYVSGVVQSIRLTAAELTRRGHRVLIVAPAYPGHRRSGQDGTGAWVLRLPSLPAPGQPVFRLPIPWRRALRALLAEPVSVVHAHSPFLTGQLARWAARRLGVPLVFTHHTLYHEYAHYGMLPAWMVVPAIRRQVGAFCRSATAVVAPTAAIARMLSSLYGPTAPVVVVPTGLPLESFAHADRSWLRRQFSIPPDAPVVIHVGRLTREKNMVALAQALHHLLTRLPGCHAVVVGSGPFLPQLRQAALHPPFAGQLHLAGSAAPEAIPRHLAGADLFLTASTTETQGLVAVEAMAAGLPVVAPKAAGIPDVVEDGREGLLTEPDGASLAEAAAKILSDPALRRAMARRAQQRAQAFDIRTTTSKLLALYGELAPASPLVGHPRPPG